MIVYRIDFHYKEADLKSTETYQTNSGPYYYKFAHR
jgi:hypothetical protein